MARGEGISMGVIVIAAIALLVLVILSVLVLRAGGLIGRGTSCYGIDGAQCMIESCDEGFIREPTKDCDGADEVCCIPSPLRQRNE